MAVGPRVIPEVHHGCNLCDVVHAVLKSLRLKKLPGGRNTRDSGTKLGRKITVSGQNMIPEVRLIRTDRSGIMPT